MISEKFIYLAVAINLIGEIIYLRSIIFGNTKPNLVSWLIWMLAPFVGVFLQLQSGAGLSVLPVFMAGFGPLLVLIVSLWNPNAYWKITLFDFICGVLSLFALILYIITHNSSISIIFAILADFLGAIPTLKKIWKFPETESGSIFIGGVISNFIGLLIIKEWIFSIYSFGLYLLIINIVILFCIYRKKIFPQRTTASRVS